MSSIARRRCSALPVASAWKNVSPPNAVKGENRVGHPGLLKKPPHAQNISFCPEILFRMIRGQFHEILLKEILLISQAPHPHMAKHGLTRAKDIPMFYPFESVEFYHGRMFGYNGSNLPVA